MTRFIQRHPELFRYVGAALGIGSMFVGAGMLYMAMRVRAHFGMPWNELTKAMTLWGMAIPTLATFGIGMHIADIANHAPE